MAQVIWQELGAGRWIAESAGSQPTGSVHPMALQVLQEIGLPIEGLKSKSVDTFAGQPFDLTVTVCDRAREACPVLPGVKQTLHWSFDDPADTVGTEEEILDSFRTIRDQIKSRIAEYLNRQGDSQ